MECDERGVFNILSIMFELTPRKGSANNFVFNSNKKVVITFGAVKSASPMSLQNITERITDSLTFEIHVCRNCTSIFYVILY